MSRLSNLSLCLSLGLGLAAGLVACDDAAVGELELEPEPSDLVCSEIVLENGRSAIARCPDGAHFSWIVDGREVLTRVSPAVVLGGVELRGSAWPEVSWSFTGADFVATVTYGGRLDLPTMRTMLMPKHTGLTVQSWVAFETPLFVDAFVPLTAGRGIAGVALGEDGFVDAADAPPRPGAQTWLTPNLLSASADRPATIGSDGRILMRIDAQVAGETTIRSRSSWTVGEMTSGFLGGLTTIDGIEPTAPIWGWRTGAAHGAVVDLDAIASERDLLLARGDAPWIVVDGLWAPAVGDWRIDPGLREATAGALLGLYWPADLICPDAPGFDDALAERQPSESACDMLDPNVPAARDRVLRAAFGLTDQAVDGYWLATDAFARTFGSQAVAVEAPQSRYLTSLDRVAGTPGADCRQEALNGPFPRSLICETALSTLDSAADAPQFAPIEGARRLMRQLDVWAVSPLPLTLTGPSGEARQRIVLTALGGGHMLIADAPSKVPEDAWSWLSAARARPDAFRTYPRLTVEEWPPSVWASDIARIVFNFTDAPINVAIDTDWIGTPDLLLPEIEATPEVSIPAHDVRVFVRPSR